MQTTVTIDAAAAVFRTLAERKGRSPGSALSAVIGLGTGRRSVLIGDWVPKAYVGQSLGVLLTMGSVVQLGVAPAGGFLLDVPGYQLVGIAMAVPMGLAGIIG